MLTRPEDFDQQGRAQDLQECKEIDDAIIEQFDRLNIGYINLDSNDNAAAAMRYIKRL
jgi:hypothetical protein